MTRFFAGKHVVEIRCPVHFAHHRKYVFSDISIDSNGWAEWKDELGRTQVGYMGQGACCWKPSIVPCEVST